MSNANSTHLRIIIQLAILLMAFTLLFKDTIRGMVIDWSINDNYSHGYLVPFIAGYMVWRKKDQLQKLVIESNILGLIVLVFGMIVFIIGNIGAELFTMRTAMVITIAGLCIYYLGVRFTLAISIPIFYLMFMVPVPLIVWNKLAFPLQLFAAKLTTNVVQLIGIPLLREGNVLQLPNVTLEVVDACSGLRSLTSLLALSAAFAYISKLTITRKWLLFLSAIPIAIVVNILRLTSTALLATYISPETARGFLHNLSGIIVFIVASIILYGIYSMLHRFE